MREIIFRGKRIDNGKLDYGYLYKEGSQSFILKSGRHYPDVIYGPTPLGILDWCEVIPETVGQFTGLHDKNGVEIYEGDLIHVFYKLLDGNYYVDAIYEVKNIDFRGLSLEFVKLTNDDSSNQIPVYELAYSRGTIGGYNGCIEVLSYYAHGEEFNHASKEVEIIGNIHDNQELAEVKYNGTI